EARTRGIVESAADAIITISQSGIIESYNAAAAAMFDYPQEQVIGRSINRLMPSPYREEHDGYIERYLRTGEARIIGRSREVVALRRDGTTFPIELAVSEVTLGNRRTFTGIITDMTVRKQTEDALRESEGRQSLILGSVPMALYAADPPPTFDTTWVSEQILVLSGFPPDRFVKDPKLWARRLHPDDRERVFRELTALREDKTVASEYRWQCADGEYRWFLDQPVLIRDEAGQPREIIGTWLDIDERKRAEHELRITQFAVDHAGEAIFWVGPDARFFAVNDAACRSLGYSREELLTMTVHDIDPNYPLEAWEEAWGEFRERRFATIESSNRSREGRVFPVEVAVNFMEFDGREFVCAFVRDITERKRAAEELRKAMESAEAASRAKSTFLANVSHEIRTPITAMLAAAEALAGQEATELSTSQQVDMVVRNGRHLLALVDDLLDLSRVEAGRHEIRRTRADLLEIIADVNAAIEPLHRRPEVQFRILYDTPLPGVITTDATRLKQAIINLVKNALKFTAVGHVRLRIAADADAPDPRLTATVEDSGVGISDRDQPRIFEAFTQAEPGTAKFREGVGLGLPLSRWIAEELGGSLEVTSESGRGSRFTLRVSTGSLDDVEWLSPQEAEQRVEALRGGASPKSPARLSGTVLLAEDFTDTRVLIADTLAGRGVTVTAVENGRAAVDAAMDTPFDLILMDVRMPVMDGLAATREIRRRGCLSPIIALTASRGTSSRPHLMEAGFDDLWAKPIALDTLIARVGTYLPAPDDTDAGTGGIVDPATTVPPDRRRLQQAVAEFVGSLHDRTARLREALEAHDLNEAREILHQLVGAGGLHGLPWLSDEAARLLVLAKDGKLDRCPGELEAFYAMVDRAASAVGDEGTRSA
ncbi:MAG: PAS domain S-box protein, partial [Phycisphaerae bacterium]